MTELRISTHCLLVSPTSEVAAAGNSIEIILTKEVELVALLLMAKVNLQSAVIPIWLVAITGEMLKVGLLG